MCCLEGVGLAEGAAFSNTNQPFCGYLNGSVRTHLQLPRAYRSCIRQVDAGSEADTLALLMDAAHTIREAVARVAALRALADANPSLHASIKAIKKIQAQRFTGTYWDLLGSEEFGGAARFFLEELYSDKDYSQRDAQFARVAGGLQTFFPSEVVATAVSLAQLHVLTEELDYQMAIAWLADNMPPDNLVLRYARAWKTVARKDDRNRQLEVVLAMGDELDRLTRTRGLRLMLKMMRRPAMAAGLGALQSFLEAGFDTFASMSGKGQRAHEFLNLIRARESGWISRLFETDCAACESALRECCDRPGIHIEEVFPLLI